MLFVRWWCASRWHFWTFWPLGSNTHLSETAVIRSIETDAHIYIGRYIHLHMHHTQLHPKKDRVLEVYMNLYDRFSLVFIYFFQRLNNCTITLSTLLRRGKRTLFLSHSHAQDRYHLFIPCSVGSMIGCLRDAPRRTVRLSWYFRYDRLIPWHWREEREQITHKRNEVTRKKHERTMR